MKFKVKIRRDLAKVRPEAEAIDGKVYNFCFGWVIQESDKPIYVGEYAMIPRNSDYPKEAPHWIASGDLEEIMSDLEAIEVLLNEHS